VKKEQLIKQLEDIGTLLAIKGENPFKVTAYNNAARALELSTLGDDQLEELARSGSLITIKGIGSSIAEKINEFLEYGKISLYEELVKQYPSELLQLLKIPGVGPRKIKVLYEELNIKSIGELEYACLENRLIKLPGFGEKTQSKILKGIENLKKYAGKFLYPVAEAVAGELVRFLQAKIGIEPVVAGSLRRRKEIIKDIDILIASDKSDEIVKAFLSWEAIESVIALGETKVSINTLQGLQVDLRVVEKQSFPFALQYFTGSKQHNIQLRNFAKDKGFQLNEYGLWKDGERFLCKDEAELYGRLNLDYISPELREGWGEIEAASTGTLPDLVEEKDIKGIFHIHSRWSDGDATIAEFANYAFKAGYQYIGISEHSQSAYYAGGLKPEQIPLYIDEVRKVNQQFPGLKILAGMEVDILSDGTLDYSDSVLNMLDFVIASVHSHFRLPQNEMTSRIIKAIAHPAVTILGHPTGRLLLSREPYAIDIREVIFACAKRGVWIEINASPYRLDLDWRYGKMAKEAGVKVVICPDAHSLAGLNDIRYGVGIARKAWLTPKDIINTYSIEDFKKIKKII